MKFLLNVAPVRPVFIWGPPGIGKSAIVEQYAQAMGLPCVSLLGSQLAPEDIIGVPQIVGDKSHFCPPRMIARDEPYVLFLDELNACTPEVQKAFYSLIHERRIGEYQLPAGSVVIGAGNRKQDKALSRPIASALINRLIHVELQADTDEWLAWARQNEIHPSILQYLKARPDHLLSAQTKEDAPFSTPRSWHMLSDALYAYQETDFTAENIQVLAAGCLSAQHAGQFSAFARNWLAPYVPEDILSGKERIPFEKPEEATFRLASVRAYLIDKLPAEATELNPATETLVLQAIDLIERTAQADSELVRYFITPEDEDHLPPWFVEELTSFWSNMLQIPEVEVEAPLSPFGRRAEAPPSAPPSPFGRRPETPPGTSPSPRPGGLIDRLKRAEVEEEAADLEKSPPSRAGFLGSRSDSKPGSGPRFGFGNRTTPKPSESEE
jgi:hypothetical protein